MTGKINEYELLYMIRQKDDTPLNYWLIIICQYSTRPMERLSLTGHFLIMMSVIKLT